MIRAAESTRLLLGVAIIVVSCCCSMNGNSFVQANSITASTAHNKLLNEYVYGNAKSLSSRTTLPSVAFLVPRGGEIADDDSEYDLDESEDEYDDESEEEEEVVKVKKTKLSSSAVKASAKVMNQKTKQSKKIVNASLSTKKKKVSTPVAAKKSKRKLLHIPYILKALLNPFTVFSMTRGYFASLLNIDYLKEDTSQTLRSALQEKAKQQGGQSKKPGRGRKMKPGQAKTLSDLPVLNA